MPRSISLSVGKKSGETYGYDIREWAMKFYELFKGFDSVDPFKWMPHSLEVIQKIAVSNLDKRAPSVLDIVQEYSSNKAEFPKLLEMTCELDSELRQFFTYGIDDVMAVVGTKIPHDSYLLVVDTIYYGRPDETGFERHIESCRREGEVIHPELDRRFREYKSLLGETPEVLLRYRHCL